VGQDTDYHKLEARISKLEGKQVDLGREFLGLKQSINQNTKALSEYIDLSRKLKVGLSFLGLVERGAVWITKCAAAFGSTWAVWKFAVSQALAQIKIH
jgi:hypothetical protein